ncbi:MAG TPA: lipoate--protein ligase family protein [Terriglobia bacterium]|nr:lipoate--protein ligase family protein [Terriglobia bacterium]
MVCDSWNLVVDGPLPAGFNMAVDEVLLEHVSDSSHPMETYVRFYQWERPTLSLGFSQKAIKVVDLDYCKSQGIEVVRRITGGKAVLHDQEITYAVISNDWNSFPSSDIGGTYRRIAMALLVGLREMGLEPTLAEETSSRAAPHFPSSPSCFATTNHYEILCQGRKLVGSAQRRTRMAFLQHGSILLGIDPDRWGKALRNRLSAEIWSRATSLSACLGYLPEINEVVQKLVSGFRKSFRVDLRKADLDGPLRRRALGLSNSKYNALEWDRDLEMA